MVVCLGVSLSMALLFQHAAAVELHLLHCWGEQRAEWVETMASEFSTAYPDVKVNVQLVGWRSSVLWARRTAQVLGR